MATRTQTLPAQPQSSLRRQVLKLGLPAVGEQFLNMLVGLSDTYLVGHISATAAAQLGYESDVGLASVGLATTVLFLVTTLIIAGAIGCTALVARMVGSGDQRGANQAAQQAVILGLFTGIIGLVLMYVFAPTALRLLSADDTIVPLGIDFLRITAFSMPLTAILFTVNATLRGVGDTKTPLLVMLLVNGLNIAISWLLINGQFGLPTLGVSGAAWGTAIGRAFGGLVVLAILIRGHSGLRLQGIPRPNYDILRRIVHIGLPTGAEQLFFQGAILIYARLITGLGTVEYAAHNLVITTHSISFLPGFGFAIAATTLVGQNLGANDPQRARRSGHEATFQAALFMALMGALFVLFPQFFLGILTSDARVVEAGIVPLRLVGAVQPILAASFVYAGALRGAGDTLWPLLTKVISPWLVRLPLALLLIPVFGLTGAWIGMCLDFVVQGVLTWWRFRGSTWERIRV